MEHTELRYHVSRGPFLEISEKAGQDPEHFYVLVIDEINRGDPARIFGELLYALEYRDPDPNLILEMRSGFRLAVAAAGLLGSFNQWLEQRLDTDHTLGHSFFLNPTNELKSEADVKKIWNLDVRPLLEEYFFGDRESLDEAGKKWTSIFRQQLSELDSEDA